MSLGDIFFILVVCAVIWGIMTLVNRSRRRYPGKPPSVPDVGAGDSFMRTLLTQSRVVAVIGPPGGNGLAGGIERFLRQKGYDVYAVASDHGSRGERDTFCPLEDLPRIPDLVVIAVPGSEVSPWASSAVKIGARALWMEKGTVCPEAMHLAREAGVAVVMDHSVQDEHQRLIRG